jgi:predicted ester cyclase
MTVQENKAAVLRALERLSDGDVDGYLELYDPDAVLHGLGPEPLDVAGARAFYSMLVTAFRGSRVTADDFVGEGDKLTVKYSFRGRHQGEFMGVPATGNDVTIGGITILRFEGGRVAERWNSADFLGLLTQIGAVPAPAPA